MSGYAAPPALIPSCTIKSYNSEFVAADGKYYPTDCANTETMFRIIQSIPSPKVEPLKQWLARVGYERIEEIENPELSMVRMQALYDKKGYQKELIDKRCAALPFVRI